MMINWSPLVSTEDFKDLIPPGLGVKLDYLRRVGNMAIHNPKGVSRDQAVLALQNLHSFLDFTTYCYGSITKRFRSIKRCWKPKAEPAPASVAPPPAEELDFQTLLDENFPKREKLTQKEGRAAQTGLYRETDRHDGGADAQGLH